MSTNTRVPRFRNGKLDANYRVRGLKPREGTKPAICTPAGGKLFHRHIRRWLDPPAANTLDGCEEVIDVYIEQVCHAINRRRNTIKRGGRIAPGDMRVMLSQPHTFYLTIWPANGEQQGSAMLRAANISRAEFRQLEYFFVPIILHSHACVVAISPLHHTVELLDSAPRDVRAICKIFNVIVRFLIHELGTLPAPRWKFLHSNSPTQLGVDSCGNFTCLVVKALAGGLPLDQNTDLGQGSNVASESRMIKCVIDDLFHQGGWSERILPLGNETIPQRHGPGGDSELQCGIFLNLPALFQPQPNDHATTKMVNLLRANISVPSLVAFCRSRGFFIDASGNIALRMQGYQQWALMSWSKFLAEVELHN